MRRYLSKLQKNDRYDLLAPRNELQKGSSSANLHGSASEAVSQLGLQRTAGVIDLGIPVFELVSFVKHCHVPWDP